MSELTGTFDTVAERRRAHGMSLWRKLWLHRIGIIGISIMLAFVIGALFGSWLAPKDPIAIDLRNNLASPVWIDPDEGVGILGTDNLGRDVLSRMLVGSKLSLIVAFSAVSIGMVSGVFLGLLTGYRGGLVDDVIMRIADTQTAIPFLVLLIAVIAFLGGGLLNMIVFLGIGSWVGFARLVRGEVLSLRETTCRPPDRSARATSGSCSDISCQTPSSPP